MPYHYLPALSCNCKKLISPNISKNKLSNSFSTSMPVAVNVDGTTKASTDEFSMSDISPADQLLLNVLSNSDGKFSGNNQKVRLMLSQSGMLS